MAKLPEDRRAVFADVYAFYERHWDMPDTVESWQECARDMGETSAKHGDTVLIMQLLMACYTAIEDENRAVREALRHG